MLKNIFKTSNNCNLGECVRWGRGGGDEVVRWWLVSGSGKGGAKPDGLVIVNRPYSYSQ